MKVLVTPTFIEEVRKLSKSNSHSSCEASLIEEILLATFETVLQTGSPKKIGGTNTTPFVRKRISSNAGRSSGYRLYLWAYIKEEDIYLIFIHPKTGRRSAANLSKEMQKELVKSFIKLNKKSCKEIIYSKERNKIIFSLTKELLV